MSKDEACCKSCGDGHTCESTLKKFDEAYQKHGAASIKFHLTDVLGGEDIESVLAGIREYLGYLTPRIRFDSFMRQLGALESFGAISRRPSEAELRMITAYDETARRSAQELESIQAVRRGQSVDVEWLLTSMTTFHNVARRALTPIHGTIQSLTTVFDSRLQTAIATMISDGRRTVNAKFFKKLFPIKPSLFEMELLTDHLNTSLASLNYSVPPASGLSQRVANLAAHMLLRESEYLAMYLTIRNQVQKEVKNHGDQWFKGYDGGLEARVDNQVDAYRVAHPDQPYFVRGPFDESDPEFGQKPSIIDRLKGYLGKRNLSFVPQDSPAPRQAVVVFGNSGTSQTPTTPKIDFDKLREQLTIRPKTLPKTLPKYNLDWLRKQFERPKFTPDSPKMPPVVDPPAPDSPSMEPPPATSPSTPDVLTPPAIITARELILSLDPEIQPAFALLGLYIHAACIGAIVLPAFDEPAEVAQFNADLMPLSNLIGATDICQLGEMVTFAGAELGLLS